MQRYLEIMRLAMHPCTPHGDRMTTATTVILGGTGKTGRRIANRLTARGLPVRIGSRTGVPAFDWHDRTTWTPALAGATALYIAYPPDLTVPEAPAHIGEVAHQAVACGVRRIVLLSGRGEPAVLPSEQAVRDAGAAFTILRCAWFCQNFSEGDLRDAVLGGEIAFPAGTVAEPFVDADDIADVATAALTDDAHAGQIYELTGPQLLTFAQAAAELAQAIGREVRYVPISSAAYAEALAVHVGVETATLLTALFEHVLDGHNAHLSDGVQRALGRPPRDFRTYARAAAAAGAWAP
jgi:uncharacterized protein YbjT (DUF2867 family)